MIAAHEGPRFIHGMSLEREPLAKEIHSILHQLAGELKSLTKNGLNDGVKVLEVTTMHFFNALHGWQLQRLEEVRKNYPAADLGDFTRRIAVQVTNNATTEKIKDTRTTALDPVHPVTRDFDVLYILFFISETKPKTPPNLLQPSDKPQIETWDLSDILAELLKTEPDRLRAVLAVLRREMTHFQSEIQAQPARIHSPKFIHHAAEHFLGREDELKLLDTAWTDGTNVVSLIAWGGVGKTALITEWVQARFIDKQWKTGDYQPALAAYFDWTFYDQGTSARTGSVGDFFEQALDFFGDPDPNLPGKGGRLADLIRQQRSLIILDGIEPLQYPPGSTSQAGHLLDPDLNELLRALAIGNPGLCIITSRQALTDLHGLRRSVHVEHDLEDLPVPIATRLLRQFQIKGTDQELADASEKFGCHALSLTLLGRYLCDAHDGDIRRIDQINLHRADTLTREDRHRTAWRVLETYESWLATAQADSNPTTLAILRLTGLFDRTATAGCLAALRAEPIIPGLTDSLCGMENDEWNILLKRLERAHLIKLRESTNLGSQIADQSSIDAHPLIREYFAQQLKQIQPEAFKAAHSRLFDHLCATTEYRPDTLIGLQPLYQAVMHGCLAARQQDVCENIYIARINRGFGQDGFFSTRKLGAFDSDLAAVANFFEDESWARVSPSIKESHIAWLFNAAGYRLRALGRLEEALKPTQISCGMDEAEKDLDGAARSISNLSQLEVDLGHLSDAVVDSHRAIYFADRHREAFQRIISRATAASALHQSGQRVEAQRFFVEAETIQAGDQPEFPLLYSLSGFRYAELLLSQAEFLAWQTCVAPSFGDLRREISNGLRTLEAEVFANCAEIILRAKKLHEWQSPSDPPLDIALNNLTHTRALLYQALPMRFDQPKSRTLDSKTKIAISYLRQANQVQFLPLALLTAAFYHGTLGENLEEAERLLDEAQQIAERGPMPLYLADVHLHRARLFGRPKGTASAKPRSESSGRNEDLETPEPHRGLCGPHSFPHIDPKAELAEARRLIEKHGYWRRREELEDAEAAAVSW